MERGELLAVGLMSGTSVDGVSAALVRIGPGRKVQVVRHRTDAYSPAERRRLLALGSATAAGLSEANFELGRRFARAALSVIRKSDGPVRVIGSHGHTVHHDPGRHTLQIGEPSVIAEETGIDVVADFRPRDVAAGGQGAPLVPYFDQFLFGSSPRRRAILNIGGIANVTIVGEGRPPLAFDTGPGNGLIDEAVRIATRGRASMDRNGSWAERGEIDPGFLARLSRHPYFDRRPPKSTGRELFNRNFLLKADRGLLRRRPADAIATLTYFTAGTIASALERFAPRIQEVVVSGGGALNPVLRRHLEWLAFPAVVRPSTVYGLDVMAKECAAFALLAAEAVRGRTNTVPSATGARRGVIAGKFLPGGGGR